ncbi:hypothetical protein SRB5_36430 [Streptomyces sp. RB5]|uniref:Uncharacterized protein n=1 Tax=Streptomyces smaragdinus TaxID=2585196 RepID=A0A7K0CJ34_9ACTN|nr:hypothetical protein [Streptomyces smaragdinus]MQY13495.1 hypothetical protein [Streptomyces smaragdinus]
MSRGIRFVVLGLGLMLLAGCGDKVAGAGGVPPSEASEGARWTLASPIRIDGVRTADGGRSLVVGAEVPDGPRPCVRSLRGEVDHVGDGVVSVRVTYESPAGDRESGCTGTRRVEVPVQLDEPLGTRKVGVGYPGNLFTPVGATPPALRKCGENGCDPTPPRCTPDSYRQAVNSTDIADHTHSEERGCDGKWLVLDLSTRMGPACGEPGDGCSSSSVSQRWFYRAGESGWRPVATSGDAGCGGVRKVVPEFPEGLCASLPSLPRD